MPERYAFGAGNIWITPKYDVLGNAITLPTPLFIGALQDGSYDVSREIKTLHGQGIYPVAAGGGKAKISGKAKFAVMRGDLWNAIMFGITGTSGSTIPYFDPTGALVPAASGPYTITVDPPGSGTFSADLGVRDQYGLPMTKVAASPGPSTGQYAESAGVYTFAAADTGKRVYPDYKYALTTGTTYVITNTPQGPIPYFELDLGVINPNDGTVSARHFYCCASSKLSFATKMDDFVIPEFDFEGFADSSGNVLSFN